MVESEDDQGLWVLFNKSLVLSSGCNNIPILVFTYFNVFMFLQIGLCFFSREVGQLCHIRCPVNGFASVSPPLHLTLIHGLLFAGQEVQDPQAHAVTCQWWASGEHWTGPRADTWDGTWVAFLCLPVVSYTPGVRSAAASHSCF